MKKQFTGKVKKNPYTENYPNQICAEKQHQRKYGQTDNQKNDKLETGKKLGLFSYISDLNFDRTFMSTVTAVALLILLNHYYTLPINRFWLFTDPIIISVLITLTCYFFDTGKKIIPVLLLVIEILYDFYPVFCSVLYNHSAKLWIYIALSFGIPLFMSIVWLVWLFEGSL